MLIAIIFTTMIALALAGALGAIAIVAAVEKADAPRIAAQQAIIDAQIAAWDAQNIVARRVIQYA